MGVGVAGVCAQFCWGREAASYSKGGGQSLTSSLGP